MKTRSICLIRPANFMLYEERLQTPLGILYLAAYLREHGVKVTICDLAGEPKERWPSLIPEADIYGISMTTGDVPIATEVGSLIKELYPRSLLVAGGAHPSAMPLDTVSNGPFDLAVVGPGEQPLLDLAAGSDLPRGSCRRERDTSPYMDAPPGWTIRQNLNPVRPKSLAGLPMPAWDLIPDVVSYNLVERGEPATCILASMGCTFRCSYCSQPVFGRRYLTRPMKDVAAELKFLKSEYGITQVRLVDELQMASPDRFIDLCLTMGKLGLKWRTHTRADLVVKHRHRNLLRLARDSGCVELAIGVENPDDRVLKLVNKRVTVAQCTEAVEMIKAAGIKSKCYFIIGLPGETWDTVENTKRWIKEVNPGKCTLSCFAPYPGCDIWLNPWKYNFTLEHDRDWRLFWMLGYENTNAPFVGLPEAMTQEDLIKARQELNDFMVRGGYKDAPPSKGDSYDHNI